MALLDDLAEIAARAKEAETRTAAAMAGKARADLVQEVSAARASAQAQAERLRGSAQAGEAKVSTWVTGLHASWDEHLAEAREGIDATRAERDMRKANRRADDAEGFAAFAIELAYWSVLEAEYAVLHAALARLDAEQLEERHRQESLSRVTS